MTQTGPDKVFMGCFFLGWGLGLRTSEGSPLWNKKCLEWAP